VVFNSLQYAAFLPAVLLLYWRLHRRGQNFLLLGASWFFYGLFGWRFLGLMLLSTGTDYTVGRVLPRVGDERRRRLVFAASLAVNLGILGVFKYWDFFITSVANGLHPLGLDPGAALLRVVLPVGISFYTFHGISYTFDVYRGDVEPARSLLDFACFVAYFPQLVAGPIGRAQVQLPQFQEERPRPTWQNVRGALFLILLGLFKKVAVADALATYVNPVFQNTAHAGWASLLVGMFGFAIQIYADFSGYTDIAIGSSRLLGIELLKNFEQPYLSRNITEFWQRWHISLSTWLRDYLYIPLGGNRGSEWATYRNLLLTMLIGGLWHGAHWTFVVWGGLHGVLLAAHRLMRRGDRDVARAGRPWVAPRDLLATAATFVTVAALFVFFRATSVAAALQVFGGLLTLRPGPVAGDAVAILLYAMVAMFAIDVVQRRARQDTAMLRWPVPARGLALAALAVPVVIFSGGTPSRFIYFRF
jgi:D-alanyl-lipoteichoic acid acyltransferase DltB (MBOAT superfamily)